MQPLEGIKILDFTLVLPGMYCTMLLADMGAEVIKVEEAKLRWEPGRLLLPSLPPEEEPSEDQIKAAYFVERNKKSIALNLKDEKAREAFYRLAEQADVIVEGFRPGVTNRLGVDYETIKKVNPRIIYCSITGYGQDGPYQDLAGHDGNYQAISGVLGLSLTPEGRPFLGNVPMGDLAGGGMQGALGIAFALIAREKTGKGQYIDISITDGLFSWLMVSPLVRSYFISGRSLEPGEGLSHFVLQTKDDKYVLILPVEPWFWENLCRALDVEEYIPYQKDILFYKPHGDSKRDEILSRLSQIFSTKTRDEWFSILWNADTCISPIYSLEEVLKEPHLIHRRMITEVSHPTLGMIKHPGIPIKLSDTPGEIKNVAPLRGQHTREALLQAGCSKEEIEEMIKKGTIYCAKL
ncbi:MAG: CaiB/BaiF CoA-transferase family protein [Chloroflexota bacterium]|nr:CaiB/BaiF CoA-transferase family protein [Chloroflexota bacterium]